MLISEVQGIVGDCGTLPLDTLSELFLMQEFYQQLEPYDIRRDAGNHMYFVSLMQRKEFDLSKVSIGATDSVFYQTSSKDDFKMSICIDRLLPYEKYLLFKALMKTKE